MKSNLDPKTITEYDVFYGPKKVKRITRTFCELCGEVLSIEIENYDGTIEYDVLDEGHTSCSE